MARFDLGEVDGCKASNSTTALSVCLTLHPMPTTNLHCNADVVLLTGKLARDDLQILHPMRFSGPRYGERIQGECNGMRCSRVRSCWLDASASKKIACRKRIYSAKHQTKVGLVTIINTEQDNTGETGGCKAYLHRPMTLLKGRKTWNLVFSMKIAKDKRRERSLSEASFWAWLMLHIEVRYTSLIASQVRHAIMRVEKTHICGRSERASVRVTITKLYLLCEGTGMNRGAECWSKRSIAASRYPGS